MSKYRIGDVIVNTDKNTGNWDEKTRWDGRNHISVNTGSQWEHEELYRSKSGRYYIVSWSQWQGSGAGAIFVTNEQAAEWLLFNNHEETMPEELKVLANDLED